MFDKILKKIKPTRKEEQEVLAKVNELLGKINSKLINARAIVGGSFAKGTWLRGQHDIDIFVLFENKENMSLRLEVVIKSIFIKYEKVHGSRDYFIVDYNGLSFELVPVLRIEKPEDAENITDVSPMHVDWVRRNINNKLADEIRLAKYFIKVNGCYGAETYIGGFSGYLVELLVIYYKGFMNFAKNVSIWRYGFLIYFENKNNFFTKQKFPLLLIDPVQPNRNVAAALREEKFNLFIELCKKFCAKPSDKFFKEKKVNLKKYDLVLRVTPLDGSKDVVGTKILKTFEKIKKELNENEFNVVDSGWYWKDYAYFYFKVKNKSLNKYKKHFGPPVKFEDYADKFKLKHKNFKIGEEEGRLFVMLPREITKLNDFIKYLANNKDILARVNGVIKL